MPKYIVTGGESGDATIEVNGKTFEVGDTVELKSNDWLITSEYVKPLKQDKETK